MPGRLFCKDRERSVPGRGRRADRSGRTGCGKAEAGIQRLYKNCEGVQSQDALVLHIDGTVICEADADIFETILRLQEPEPF